MATFVPEVAYDTLVFGAGLFLVTSVGLAVKSLVDQLSVVLHRSLPTGITQSLADIVPEGVLETTVYGTEVPLYTKAADTLEVLLNISRMGNNIVATY